MVLTRTFWPVYAARVWKMGKSVVFPLYRDVMDAIGAEPGSLILIKVHPPYVTFRVVRVGEDIPVYPSDIQGLEHAVQEFETHRAKQGE
jgi:hypothetical protein